MGSFGEKRKKMFFRFCRPILDIFGFPLLSNSSYCLYNYIACLVSVMLARFTIPSSHICTVAYMYEVDFRPKILQYMDFFAYSRGRAILTDDKQLHCRLTDANFF